jgi:hypothetical protein
MVVWLITKGEQAAGIFSVLVDNLTCQGRQLLPNQLHFTRDMGNVKPARVSKIGMKEAPRYNHSNICSS